MSQTTTDTVLSVLVIALLTSCNEVRPKDKVASSGQSDGLQSETNKLPLNSPAEARPNEHRFVFPPQASSFPAASVALDTETGQLCKTYPWADNQTAPRGLPLCSAIASSAVASSLGAKIAYLGFTYSFDGSRWRKGPEARKYNDKTAKMEPLSDDQYDPLNLFSKEEKAKRVLTEAEIRRVADQFGVSYLEAWQDAKAQGYQVPQNRFPQGPR